jgi:hypothetical protein
MKSFQRVKATLLLVVLFIGTILSIAPPPASAKLITYNSELQLTYDVNAVQNAIFSPTGTPVSIPINVSFHVFVPEKFVSNIWLRLLFLQTMIITNAKITFTIENPPDWAAISIANPNVYIDISTSVRTSQTAIIITPHSNAPSEGFNLKIKAETTSLLNGHIPPNSAEANIQFQPGYIPLIDVQTDNPSRIVGPQETVTFPIRITNLGNKQTLVTAKITNYPEGWAPLLPESTIIIPSISEAGAGNNVATMAFSITPPYGLGWHNELQTITIEFTPQFSPPVAGKNLTGTPINFQVTVRNRGFSTPGFELVGVVAAVIIVGILLKKRRTSE